MIGVPVSIFQRSLVLGAADFTKKALLAATVLTSVRFLPSATFGDYMFLLSFYQVFSVLGGAGIATNLVRDVAQQGINQPGLVLGSAMSRMAYILPAGCLMYGVMVAARYPSRYYNPLLILVVLMALRGFTENLISIFQGNHDQVSCAKIGVVQSVVSLLAVLAVCVTSKQLIHLVTAHVIGAIASAVYGVLLLSAAQKPSRERSLSADFQMAGFLLKESIWMNGGTFLASAYNRADVLLLRRMSTSEAVAVYSAPYRILDIVQIVPASIMGVLLPKLCHAETAQHVPTGKVLRLILVIALLLVVVVTLTSGWIVPLLFGRNYSSSTPILRILIWAAIPMFWNFVLNSQLIASRFEKAIAWSAAIAVGLNLSLNSVFIPQFSFYACAVITVVTEFALLFTNLLFLSRRETMDMPERPIRLAVAGLLVLGFCVLWTYQAAPIRLCSLGLLAAGVVVLPVFRGDLGMRIGRGNVLAHQIDV